MTAVNISEMADKEIQELAERCLDCLTLDVKVQTILKALHSQEERDELAEWLQDEEDEEEVEEG
jgi:hypothetical protein